MSFPEVLIGILGDEESMPKSGVLMSPNYPQRYPSSHDSTQTIEVAEGKRILFVFSNFITEPEYDWVRIEDENGTDLLRRTWGSSPPGTIISKSNIIHVKFHTDDSRQRSGWRMEWTEV